MIDNEKKYFNIDFSSQCSYILEGIWLNPLILWILLPMYIGYAIVYNAKNKKRFWQGYNFLIASIGFSYFYHLLWFFNVNGAKDGASTASLIFVWAPIWAVLFGFIGYFIGSFVDE